SVAKRRDLSKRFLRVGRNDKVCHLDWSVAKRRDLSKRFLRVGRNDRCKDFSALVEMTDVKISPRWSK
ncbi:MAG: hypothetical protein ABH820_01950, partial [Patescibacteria group bacterium]